MHGSENTNPSEPLDDSMCGCDLVDIAPLKLGKEIPQTHWVAVLLQNTEILQKETKKTKEQTRASRNLAAFVIFCSKSGTRKSA
jgi:hypothetical protein